MSEGARPRWQQLLGDVAVVTIAFLLAGLVAGALWPQLVDPVTVTRNDFGILTDEVALAERFDNDGWFSLLGLGFGLSLGLALTMWRRGDEVVTLLAVVAGAFLAAWVAARLGAWLGPEDPQRVLADAELGDTAPGVVELQADAAYLVWPIAALVGALVALWRSSDAPNQRRDVME